MSLMTRLYRLERHTAFSTQYPAIDVLVMQHYVVYVHTTVKQAWRKFFGHGSRRVFLLSTQADKVCSKSLWGNLMRILSFYSKHVLTFPDTVGFFTTEAQKAIVF